MSTVGDVTARNVVLGQIRGEAVYVFDLDDVATVIALHRKVGTNVVIDLRLKGVKEPREDDIWLLGAIGPRWSLHQPRRRAAHACDRMVTFAHTARTAPGTCGTRRTGRCCPCRSRAPAPNGTRGCTVRQFNDLLPVLPPHRSGSHRGAAAAAWTAGEPCPGARRRHRTRPLCGNVAPYRLDPRAMATRRPTISDS